MSGYRLDELEDLEAESIHIIREVAAELDRPVMLYSVGKDSSVMIRLAQKAFWPAPVPFPLLHVDTGYKFAEMIAFRDAYAAEIGADLIVFRHSRVGDASTHPRAIGTAACCGVLKTEALLMAIRKGGYDAALGGARREEERSRAKERICSFRDEHGRWDPKQQRPELWQLYNTAHKPGEHLRVFPLSNWTEIDVWRYIQREAVPVVPMYFAAPREVVVRGDQLIPAEGEAMAAGERVERVWCRFRTLGCSPCTGAVRSNATTVEAIIEELMAARLSERITRIIDHDRDGSMELKKREGYF